MGLAVLTRTAEMVGQMKAALTEADKEYVVQFAFRTGDGELTNKLIDELIKPDADRQAVFRRFETMTDFRLEMYRVQEERALKALSAMLSAYGINLSEDEIRKLSAEEVRERLVKNEAAQR